MNTTTVIKQSTKTGFRLLYSHDDGFTRYAIDFSSDGTFTCFINERKCFRRGTHDMMAKTHGIDMLSRVPA